MTDFENKVRVHKYGPWALALPRPCPIPPVPKKLLRHQPNFVFN